MAVRRQRSDKFWRGKTDDGSDGSKVLQIVGCEKERVAKNEFGKNASDRPNVDSGGIVVETEETFGRSISSSSHRLQKSEGEGVVGVPGHAKVSDAQIAIAIDQNVGGFQVAVKNACGM